ncbi:unnamed protein product [Rhizophagus irregularis]|nr:unnamed protein product [Rhizophagus irregularis]
MQSTSIQDLPSRHLESQDFGQQTIRTIPTTIKKSTPGIATNLLYKVIELAIYTSAFATDAINTLNGVHSTRRNYTSYDNEIDDDDENVYNHNKKDDSTWNENVENVEESESGQRYLIQVVSPCDQDSELIELIF